MARLLILTPSELERDPRGRRQASAARALGHEVVAASIWTGSPEAVATSLRRRIGLTGMQRRRSALLRELVGVVRLLRLMRWTVALVRAGKARGAADVVHANDLDTLPAGAWLARRGRARLVYDAHDLYRFIEEDPPRLYTALTSWLEGLLARRADAVVTTGTPYAEELTRLLRLRRPPEIVMNTPALVEAPAPPARSDGPLRAIYMAGADMPGRSVASLLDVAELCPGVEIAIRVVVLDRRALADEVARRGLTGRVSVLEPVEPTELVASLAGFDAGIVLHHALTRNDELCIPNKLFEYTMAGLAVVAPRLPALAFVADEGVGVAYDPGDPGALAAALTALAEDPVRLEELRRRGRELAVERFNAEAQLPALRAAWAL